MAGMLTAVAVADRTVAALEGDSLRVGTLGDDGVAGGWGEPAQVPGWRFRQTVDVGVAVSGRDVVVLAVVARARGSAGFIRTGRDLGAGEWTAWTEVPGWRGRGGDVAVDAAGEPIVVAGGRYRAGGEWRAIPGWPGGEVRSADAADLDGDGRPELLVSNGRRRCIGWGFDESGRPADGWGEWTAGGGGAIATAGGRPQLLALKNRRYRAAPLELDIDKAKEKGVWRVLDFDSQIIAVHAALLHTGDVLLFAGSGYSVPNHRAHRYRTRVWRYPSAKFTAPSTPIDLFCCGHAFLPGGRLLAAGGTKSYDPFRGIPDALAFDPRRRRWLRLRKMAHARWYPSLITLADGRVIAVSGRRGEDNQLEREPEIFEPGLGWRPLKSPGQWPFYPHLTLLDDGRVFYSGGHMGIAAGAKPGIWNPANGHVATVPGLPMAGMRNQAASVLLPPAQEQRVMIVGGGGAGMHDHEHNGMKGKPEVATKSVAIADLSAASPRYKAAAPLRHARMHQNLVLLPDRTVMVAGGAAVEEHKVNAALESELFDPGTGRWRALAKARVARLYHSVALLMPDGKVITAGSNPKRTVEELRIEVYSPPYLFKGPRPKLILARDHAAHGAKLKATAGDVREINLVRPTATTHASNSEQRLIDVPFTPAGPDRVELQLPASPNLAPPGWYLVFAVNAAGVPSIGRWLRLG
jgi:galactose oxidase-like protein